MRKSPSNKRPVADRFWEKVATGDDCWEWLGSRDAYGYGSFSINRRARLAHRVAWLLVHGSWPDGHVLHRCDNPSCVRPDHLFVGDQAANNTDMANKGRHWNQAKTHCPQGHPYDGTNLIVTVRENGWVNRKCRTCVLEHSRDRKRRIRLLDSESDDGRTA